MNMLRLFLLMTSFTLHTLYGAITINLTFGELKTSGGTSTIVDNSLIQLLSSSTGTFVDPTSTSFVGGDNILLTQFAMDSATSGISGAMVTATSSTTWTAGWALNHKLMLRWFPTLTTASGTPGAGTTWGGYRTDLTNLDGSNIGFIVPADGGWDLVALSVSQTGSVVDSSLYANNVTAVPEPSTYALIVGGLVMGFAVYRKRRAK